MKVKHILMENLYVNRHLKYKNCKNKIETKILN